MTGWAAIDVAKDAGVVCTRTPHPSRPGTRRSIIWTVKARRGTVRQLGRQLKRGGMEIVTLESTSDYWRNGPESVRQRRLIGDEITL